MKIAVIPARGGSKRIPRKNAKPFCGQPLICWAIDAALSSQLFDHVVVSTDDDQIADIARNAGASVPFLRPASLSDDFTPTAPVIVHAVNSLQETIRKEVDLVCCIYPTAAFLTPEILEQAITQVEQDAAVDFSVTVTEYAHPIQRALTIDQTGRLELREPDHAATRSQDLAHAYHDAGQLYCGRPDAFAKSPAILEAVLSPLVISRSLAVDIDTPEDWRIAEALFAANDRNKPAKGRLD